MDKAFDLHRRPGRRRQRCPQAAPQKLDVQQDPVPAARVVLPYCRRYGRLGFIAFAAGLRAAASVAAVSFAAGAVVETNSETVARQSTNAGLSARDMSDQLGQVEFHVHVDVVLVGFHRDGAASAQQGARLDGTGSNGDIVIDERYLQEHLDELVVGLSADGKGGVPITVVDQGHENALSKLGLRQEILFEVKHAEPQLGFDVRQQVELAIRDWSAEGHGIPGAADTVGIPRTPVNDKIHSYLKAEKRQLTAHTLYLVNPGVETRYHYIHDRQLDASAAPDGQMFPHSCGYVGWIGEHDRYAWLDLGAHVASGWGPSKRSSGIVSSSTLPDLSAAAQASREGRSYWQIYPELSALVHRTASQLMIPPMLLTPAGLDGNFHLLSPAVGVRKWTDYSSSRSEEAEEVQLHMYFVCDTSACSPDEMKVWANIGEMVNDAGAGSTAAQLSPRVSVVQKKVKLQESPLLATGLLQAGRRTQDGVTLESEELRHWLRLFIDARAESDGKNEEEFTKTERVRAIPVFVISLDIETPVLLDHSMRSTVFPDMVVSVASNSFRDNGMDSGFYCRGKTVVLPDSRQSDVRGSDNSDAYFLRETFASLSQAVWGAPPRTLAWDPLTDALGTEYLWATGASIHTPLSSHSSLTYPERDAYVRTRVLLRVDAAIAAARDLLEHAAAVEPLLVNALNAGHLARTTTHWNGMIHMLDICLSELAIHHEYPAVQNAAELERHVKELGQALAEGYGNRAYRAACLCGQDPEGGFGWWEGWAGSWRLRLLSAMYCNFLFASVVVSLILTGWLRYGSRSSWQKSKRS